MVNQVQDNVDVYQRAADELINYRNAHPELVITDKQEIKNALEEFSKKYGPEVLKNLPDDKILSYMFYSDGANKEYLCYALEYNTVYRTFFGSISGGSAYKFGLFYQKDKASWMSGSTQKPESLTEAQALNIAKNLRKVLVDGADIIQNEILTTADDYKRLDEKLDKLLGSSYYNFSWIHKYFSLIYYDKLSAFHSGYWQKHVLRALKVPLSDKYYARSCQIAKIQNLAGIYYKEFFDIFMKRFGNPINFIRIGCMDTDTGYNYFIEEWKKKNVVALGWPGLGDLKNYIVNKSIDRNLIKDKLLNLYYPTKKGTATRKAGEISEFFNTDNNAIFLVANGEKILALADKIGEYIYDTSSDRPFQKKVSWKKVFDEPVKLPVKSEGLRTSCYVLSQEDNIEALYRIYYYDEVLDGIIATKNDATVKNDNEKVEYHTDFQSEFDRNCIFFGAPGTGKSYTLNLNKNSLVGEDNNTDYERVTFHPDYTYANFVGTYKPVPIFDNNGKNVITYKYVPGPFMRVYVKALKNSRLKNTSLQDIKPFLLIIEEINRANVAAVFGDVFQLLDRDENNVSQYPIQASEDMKQYLAKELGGKPDEYEQIKIPDNMFIWATMNSADQGVFPMDTAFKRRWEFKYFPLNDDKQEDIIVKFTEETEINWNCLRKAINWFLSKEKINEDKLLGQYFIARNAIVSNDSNEINSKKFCEVFKNKVLMYLFDDAARQKRSRLFSGCNENCNSYYEICCAFDKDGIGIFNEEIREKYQTLIGQQDASK